MLPLESLSDHDIGIEDKIIKTKGYCLVLKDEGCRFFIFISDLKPKDVKHEGDLSLLNQLFDRKGDKMTLPKIRNVQYQKPKCA